MRSVHKHTGILVGPRSYVWGVIEADDVKQVKAKDPGYHPREGGRFSSLPKIRTVYTDTKTFNT